MPATQNGALQRNRRRQFDLDDPSQSSVLLHVLTILAGTGLAAAITVLTLSHGSLLGGDTVAEALPILLVALAGSLILAALITIPVVLRLTHRYVGPALVMRRALQGIRRGDYGCRLRLRRQDYLKGLAREIDAHRDDIARRDVEHARLLHGIKHRLDDGDVIAARVFLQWHSAGAFEEVVDPAEVEREAKAG